MWYSATSVDWMEVLPKRRDTVADTRDNLVNQLHETLDNLIKFFSDEGKGRQWGSALHDAVIKHADEGTLKRINDDIRDLLAKLKSHT
jgi:hypothetical protein